MARDVRAEIHEKIIADMERNDLPPWGRSWKNGAHQNPITGTIYSPLNQALLSMAGYDDPRWITPAYCIQEKLDFKGARKEFVLTWHEVEKRARNQEQDANVEADGDHEGRPGKLLVAGYMGLFNASQVRGLPTLAEWLKAPEFTPNEMIAEVVRAMAETGLTIQHGGNQPAYYPALDLIAIPRPEFFKSPLDYYAALLHEAAHATARQGRCGRDLEGRFGSRAYSAEECIAQAAAVKLMAQFGCPMSESFIEHQTSYMKGWLELFKENRANLFWIMAEAERAAKWIEALHPQARLQLNRDIEAAGERIAEELEKTPAAKLGIARGPGF